jgi:single-strand DNA-binding protein
MYNKVILIGNLGKDPEIRVLESGAKLARFPIATNENYMDKTGNWQTITEWHNIVAWRNLADRVERDFKQGTLVFVEGKIRTNKWQDNEGRDRYNTEIIAAVLRPLEKRENPTIGGSGPEVAGSSFNPPSVENAQQESKQNDDDDLPF